MADHSTSELLATLKKGVAVLSSVGSAKEATVLIKITSNLTSFFFSAPNCTYFASISNDSSSELGSVEVPIDVFEKALKGKKTVRLSVEDGLLVVRSGGYKAVVFATNNITEETVDPPTSSVALNHLSEFVNLAYKASQRFINRVEDNGIIWATLSKTAKLLTFTLGDTHHLVSYYKKDTDDIAFSVVMPLTLFGLLPVGDTATLHYENGTLHANSTDTSLVISTALSGEGTTHKEVQGLFTEAKRSLTVTTTDLLAAINELNIGVDLSTEISLRSVKDKLVLEVSTAKAKAKRVLPTEAKANIDIVVNYNQLLDVIIACADMDSLALYESDTMLLLKGVCSFYNIVGAVAAIVE